MDPILATLLTTLASKGLSLISGAILAKGKAVVEEKLGVNIDDMVSTDEGTLKLKQIQVDHEEFLITAAQTAAERDVEAEKARLADVQSARTMQVAALQQEDKFSKHFVYYFAIGWSLFAMLYFAAVTFLPVPARGERVSDTVLGFLLGTAISSIFGYLYGTNRASAVKDTTISNLAAKQ